MTPVLKRKIGRSGIEVSALGLGCWAIGGPFWTGDKPHGWGNIDDNESIKAIQRSIELGVTFFDTAGVYGAGHSEIVLGQALNGFERSDMVIATKFGNTFNEETKQITGINISPEYIRKACQASLERLNTDYIDLYHLHLWTIDLVDAIQVIDVLEALVEEGFIRTYGWSTDVTKNAKLFAKHENCSAIQQELNVLVEGPEIIAVCEEHNLASINRTALAMGLLTGKYNRDSKFPQDDIRGNEPEWMKYFKNGYPTPEWLEKLDLVKKVLTTDGRTLPQGALSWIWGRSEKTIPIPGFKTTSQIEDNIGAMEFGPLKEEQMTQIDEVLGDRSYHY